MATPYNYGLIVATWGEKKSASSENIDGLGIHLQHMGRGGNCHCGVQRYLAGWGEALLVLRQEGLQRFFSLVKGFMLGVGNTGFLIARMLLASGRSCLVRISALGALRSFKPRSI